MSSIMIYSDGGFLKVRFGSLGNFHEFLRVEVNNGKPAALNLHHDLMAFLEEMGHLVQVEMNLLNSIGYKRLRRFITIPKLTPKYLCAHHSLKARHFKTTRVGRGISFIIRQ